MGIRIFFFYINSTSLNPNFKLDKFNILSYIRTTNVHKFSINIHLIIHTILGNSVMISICIHTILGQLKFNNDHIIINTILGISVMVSVYMYQHYIRTIKLNSVNKRQRKPKGQSRENGNIRYTRHRTKSWIYAMQIITELRVVH